MEIEQPLLTMRPKFVPILGLLSQIPIQIYFTIVASIFSFFIVSFPFQTLTSFLQTSDDAQALTGFRVPILVPVIVIALFDLIVLPITGYLLMRRRYAMTEYRFFRSNLEYYEGFFTIERKTIDYQAIAEITVREGPLQQKFGLGRLELSTTATGTESGVSRSGIELSDLEEPQKAYRQVRELMRKHP